jgi:predicted PurR-regulated permease PerM
MNPKFKQPFTFDRVVRIIIGISIAVVLFLLIKKLSGVLLPFLVAWLFAYMLYPVIKFFQFKCKIKSRLASILLAFILLAAVVSLLLFITIPPIISELTRTGDLISTYIYHINQTNLIPNDIKRVLTGWANEIDYKKLLNQDSITKGIEMLAPKFWTLLSNSLAFIISLFVIVVIFLYTVFILTDYERINSGWLQFVPEKYRPLITNILEDLEWGMNRYFRGQALIASIVGVLLATGFVIIDLPLGLLLGFIMGVCAMVPYLNVIMLPPLTFFAFLKSIETGQPFWQVALSVIAVIVIVQVIQDFILTPKIMGKAMGLRPAVILLSLSIWGSLLGIVGMIIALPATTILASYYKQFVIGNASITDASSFEKTEVEKNKRKQKDS